MALAGRLASAVAAAGASLIWVAAVPANAATPFYADAVLRSGAVAYWQFADNPSSGTLADSTGNQHPLDRNAADITSPGLQGVDGALSVSDQTALGGEPRWATGGTLAALQGDADRTVELWFKTTSTADGCLFSTGTPLHAQSFSMCLTDGAQYASPSYVPGIYLQTYDGDIFVPAPGLTDGRWHYLATTLHAQSAVIDVDGSTPLGYVWNGGSYGAVAVQPFTLPWVPNTAPTDISVGGPGWQPGLRGVIDEVAVYGTALPTAVLRGHFRTGGSATTCSNRFDSSADCLGQPIALNNVIIADMQALASNPNITSATLQADQLELQQSQASLATLQQVAAEFQCMMRSASSSNNSSCP